MQGGSVVDITDSVFIASKRHKSLGMLAKVLRSTTGDIPYYTRVSAFHRGKDPGPVGGITASASLFSNDKESIRILLNGAPVRD